MNTPKLLLALTLLLSVCEGARANDLLVDASGSGSAFPTIGAAMSVARSGDRILVLPGDYPSFQFSVGVSVIGLGALPGEVRVARVDVHVSEPAIGYLAVLSNLQAGDGGPANSLAISGNEQPPGVLVIDGVEVRGGVFLGGGADGFHLHMNDSAVLPEAGQGFAGAAMHLGGSAGFSFELVDSLVVGWNADPTTGMPAAVGLALAGPVRGRLARSELRGGSGAAGSGGGADAVGSFGVSAPVDLWIDGGSLVVGGDAFGVAGGGAGIDLAGTLALGQASISGGQGSPAGTDISTALVLTPLPCPLQLAIEPVQLHAAGPTFNVSGDTLQFLLDADPDHAVMLLSFGLGLPAPAPAPLLPLATPALFWFGSSLSLEVPDLGLDAPGLMLYAMAWVRPPTGGPLQPTNTVSRRIDLWAPLP